MSANDCISCNSCIAHQGVPYYLQTLLFIIIITLFIYRLKNHPSLVPGSPRLFLFVLERAQVWVGALRWQDLNTVAYIRQSVEIELIVCFHFCWLLNTHSSILPLT